MKIQNWQLLKWNEKDEIADLREQEIVTVGVKAFRPRRSPEQVYLPASASALKSAAFRACRRLTRVELSHACGTGISARVFEHCDRLEEVEPFAWVTSIGERAFASCRRLKAAPFGRDLRRIGSEAFRGCDSLTAIRLPASLRSIGRAAFSDCASLSSVEIEEGVTELAPDLFRDCFSLCEVNFPHTLSKIEAGAFRGCAAIAELTLPGEIRSVGKRAFFGCTRLRRLALEEGVTEIGAMAFANTMRLGEVLIPHSLKKLGWGAFGLGKRDEKAILYVDNEYMLRRVKRLLLLCGSQGCARVELIGKSIEERRRERHRTTLEQAPVHIMDQSKLPGSPSASDVEEPKRDVPVRAEPDSEGSPSTEG